MFKLLAVVLLMSASAMAEDIYDLCSAQFKGDVDGYAACVDKERPDKPESTISQDKVDQKEFQEFKNWQQEKRKKAVYKGSKSKSKSIADLCLEASPDDTKKMVGCQNVYGSCSNDIFSPPRTKKEGITQANCIASVTEKILASRKEDKENQDREYQQKLVEQQNARGEEMLDIQRQQLALQEQQQKLQIFNTFRAPPFQIPQIQPFPVMRTGY